MRNFNKIVKVYIVVIAVIVTALSCTPQKRLNRLVALHPELVKNDTIHIVDTTIIPEIRIDTAFHESLLKDTVIITKEKLTVKIHQVHDTVYLEAENAADTVIIEKFIPVEKLQTTKPTTTSSKLDDFLNKKWVWAVFGVFCTFVIIGFYLIAEKRH